jgi:hypothetical protein
MGLLALDHLVATNVSASVRLFERSMMQRRHF